MPPSAPQAAPPAALRSRAVWPPARWFPRPPQVSVLRLYGTIGPQGGPVRGSRLNLPALAGAIEAAFRPKGLAAVALAINSPGGSPVQSALIAGRIRQLADEKKVPVFAFAEDVAASGGYWIACAADEIFADRASIIGSIGVIAAGFGAVRLIDRVGVERRVHTAGRSKSFWDPFLPEDPEDVARLKELQAKLHATFIDWVRERRGSRLQAGQAGPAGAGEATGAGEGAPPAGEDLFSGAFWLGQDALRLGLVDGIGDLRAVMRGRFGPKVRLRVVNQPRSWLQRRMGLQAGPAAGAAGPGVLAALPELALEALEDRLLWSRFGL